MEKNFIDIVNLVFNDSSFRIAPKEGVDEGDDHKTSVYQIAEYLTARINP